MSMTVKIQAIVTQGRAKSLEAETWMLPLIPQASKAVCVCSKYFLYHTHIKKDIGILELFPEANAETAKARSEMRSRLMWWRAIEGTKGDYEKIQQSPKIAPDTWDTVA